MVRPWNQAGQFAPHSRWAKRQPPVHKRSRIDPLRRILLFPGVEDEDRLVEAAPDGLDLLVGQVGREEVVVAPGKDEVSICKSDDIQSNEDGDKPPAVERMPAVGRDRRRPALARGRPRHDVLLPGPGNHVRCDLEALPQQVGVHLEFQRLSVRYWTLEDEAIHRQAAPRLRELGILDTVLRGWSDTSTNTRRSVALPGSQWSGRAR